MKLNLVRYEFSDRSTLGKLSIDGKYSCYTLERPADGKNTPNQSAIPEGTYPVKKRWSHHFGRDVLEVCKVPDRTDIEIHVANLPSELKGCIAVGQTASNDFVGNSALALNAIMEKFQEPATITIESAKRDTAPGEAGHVRQS